MMEADTTALGRLWRFGLQAAKFGSVGLIATATHVTIFSIVIEIWDVDPMLSNLIAFCFAFGVSFFGHFHWTFSESGVARRSLRSAGLRFLFTALIGLALNSLVVYAVEHVFRLPYIYATIGMIFLVPPVLFIMSKYWAFISIARN